MKKILIILLVCLMLTGCVLRDPHPTTEPETEPAQTVPTTAAATEPVPETTQPAPQIPLNIYVPDENAESFYTIPTVIDEIDPNQILSLLIDHSMLDAGIELNQAALDGTQLNLDFNQAFLDQLRSYGTAGERMMIGCVVNTFLGVYDAETVYITVNSEIMESGHVIYDFPLEYIE